MACFAWSTSIVGTPHVVIRAITRSYTSAAGVLHGVADSFVRLGVVIVVRQHLLKLFRGNLQALSELWPLGLKRS
jgi:hypothetical protein